MIKIFLFLVALVGAAPAFAANAPNYPATIVKAAFNGYYDKGLPDPAAACAAAFSAPNKGVFRYVNRVLNGLQTHTSNWECTLVWANNGGSTIVSNWGQFSCPYGGTVGSAGGYCENVPAGGGPPPAVPKCTAGTEVTVTYKTGTYTPAGGVKPNPALLPPINGGTDGECEITIVDVKECVGRADGFSYCTYVGKQTGTPKAPGTGTPSPSVGVAPPAPTDTQVPVPPFTGQPGGGCPKGTVQGGVGPDGVPMCMGTGSNPPKPPSTPTTTTKPPTTTTGSDGSTVKTQETTQQNADGSTTTTTTTTTTKPDGTTSTSSSTVTGNNSGGGAGKTDTPTEDKTNFCKQNPNLSICRESSVSGSCGQTSCVGDAIQCATLRAAAAMQCKQKEDDDALKGSALHALGQAAASGSDPMASTLPTVGNASVVNMPTMAASGWIGGGSAFRDVSFTVQGKTFAIPFEKWTGYLVGLRYALMVVSMLVSFRMLSGVILRD